MATNYIEPLRMNLWPSPSQKAICEIYDSTGKEDSKFFPLLNYAAIKSRSVGAIHNEYKDAAMKWITDNLECTVTLLTGLEKDGYCSTLIYADGKPYKNYLHCSSSIILGRVAKSLTRVMSLNDGYSASYCNIPLGYHWGVIVKSVALMLRDSFQAVLEKNKRYMDEFMEDKKIVQRSIKDRKIFGVKGKLPLCEFIEQHGKYEAGNSVIFPCIPYGPVFFDEVPFICKYDRSNMTCTFFSREKIMSFSNIDGLTCKEIKNEASVYDLLGEYKFGVEYMGNFVDTMERQRKRLLELV